MKNKTAQCAISELQQLAAAVTDAYADKSATRMGTPEGRAAGIKIRDTREAYKNAYRLAQKKWPRGTKPEGIPHADCGSCYGTGWKHPIRDVWYRCRCTILTAVKSCKRCNATGTEPDGDELMAISCEDCNGARIDGVHLGGGDTSFAVK